MRASPPHMDVTGERASLLVAGGDEEVEIGVSTSRGDSSSGRRRSLCAVAVVILGAGAVASTSNLLAVDHPGLGLRNAMHREAESRSESVHTRNSYRPTASLGTTVEGGGDGDGDDIERMRNSAIETGFVLPITNDETTKHAWLSNLPRVDFFLENILGEGADALPDVFPGIPFDSNDPEYEADGWAHSPFLNLGNSDDASRRKNSFVLCIDHSSDWDVAFPEGWFQAFVDKSLEPNYCLSDIVYDTDGDWEASGCGHADVVLFNEGALIWKGAHRKINTEDNLEYYELPAKTNPNQVYVYFAHESPAGFGGELLDRKLMDQFDYLASANEQGSSAWWNFAFSARHLTQDFVSFSRPFEERSPNLAWLAIDCGGHPREGMLAEISKSYPVWSLGQCRNNYEASSDMPGRDTYSDNQRRRMQLALSQHLFYFSAENSECPGYTTEKLWMAISRGSIPVYFGDQDVKKYLPCSECVLDVRDFATAEDLATRMREIANSKDEYEKLTQWRFADPKTWPVDFRKAVAVASADVVRVTCGLLRGNGNGQKAKPALVQVAKTGGWNMKTVSSATPQSREASYLVTDGALSAVLEAKHAYELNSRQNDLGLVGKLREVHCGGGGVGSLDTGSLGANELRASRQSVFSKPVKEFAHPLDDFVDPATHYDRVCDDDMKNECFQFRGGRNK